MTNKNTTGVVYELGFHLIPLITEDEVASHVSTLKSILDKAGAVMIAEEAPTLIELAYEISKKIKGTKEHFNTGYFGWIKFETTAEKIAEIDEQVRLIEEVLRFIIVKTLPGDTLLSRPDEEDEVEDESEATEEELSEEDADSPDTDEDNSEMSEDDMDKTIDELVIE